MMALENIVKVAVMENNQLITKYYQLSKHDLIFYKIYSVSSNVHVRKY